MTGLEPDSLQLVWLVECERCANTATSDLDDVYEAIAHLADLGWTREDGVIFCPACNGASR